MPKFKYLSTLVKYLFGFCSKNKRLWQKHYLRSNIFVAVLLVCFFTFLACRLFVFYQFSYDEANDFKSHAFFAMKAVENPKWYPSHFLYHLSINSLRACQLIT